MGQSGQMDATLRSALRKASWRVIPLIALGYGTAYMDRVNISYASLQMNQDLHLSNTVYGLGAGLFFLSYAACEVPSNLMLYRIGARRWLSRIMITWGLVAMAMIFVRTPHQFYLVRFLLGAAEAGFFPGIMYYLFLWFPDAVRARAITRFYVAFPLSTVVMGSLAGWLMGLNGRASLSGWQWLFLVEALPALVLSVVFIFLLPDGPADATFLTEPERAAILAAVARDGPASGPASASHGLASLAPAFGDVRVWLIGAFYFCILTVGYAYNFSAPAIVQQITGFSVGRVGLVLAIIGLFGTAGMLIGGMHSDRTGQRYKPVILWCVLLLAGYLVCGLSRSPFLAIPALALIFTSYNATQGPMWAIPPAFLSGRSAAAGIASINMIGILGGFIGPYWMGFARDLTGGYQRGLLTMTLPLAVAIAIILHLDRINRRAVRHTPALDPVASKP